MALGELVEARDVFERGLPLRRSRVSEDDALILHNAAPLYWRLGELQKAIDSERKVLEIWSRVKDRNGTAFAHSTLGQFALQLGDTEEALRHQRAALQLWTEVGIVRGQAVSSLRIGTIEEARGNRLEALKHYRRSGILAASVNEQQERARALIRSGSVLATLGRHCGHPAEAGCRPPSRAADPRPCHPAEAGRYCARERI